MKTVFIYSAWHGIIRECAEKAAEKLTGQASFYDLSQEIPDEETLMQENCDIVVFGCSVEKDHIQQETLELAIRLTPCLATKTVGLFCCTLSSIEKTERIIKGVFPDETYELFKAIGIFDSKVKFERPSFFERSLLRPMTHKEVDMATLNDIKISGFTRNLHKAYQESLPPVRVKNPRYGLR